MPEDDTPTHPNSPENDERSMDVSEALEATADSLNFDDDLEVHVLAEGTLQDFSSEIRRIISNCQRKRSRLEQLSLRNGNRSRQLSMWSSILSLLSAITLASLVTRYISGDALAAVALCLALAGGVLAMLSSSLFNQRETVTLYLGAAKFLNLREAAAELKLNTEISPKTKRARIQLLQQRYCDLSELYGHYIIAHYSASSDEQGNIIERMSLLESVGIPGNSDLP